jgi:hypothetical protein
MGKKEGSWSGMRKYLEQTMISDAWKGRVRYNCSTAPGMDDCRFFEVYIDGVCFKRFSLETVNSYFIDRKFVEKPSQMGTMDYWKDFWQLMDQYPMEARTEYTDVEFCCALDEYRNGDIQESIHSHNPIVRMFALFDKRVGKRTILKLKEDMQKEPDWLQKLYHLRDYAAN